MAATHTPTHVSTHIPPHKHTHYTRLLICVCFSYVCVPGAVFLCSAVWDPLCFFCVCFIFSRDSEDSQVRERKTLSAVWHPHTCSFQGAKPAPTHCGFPHELFPLIIFSFFLPLVVLERKGKEALELILFPHGEDFAHRAFSQQLLRFVLDGDRSCDRCNW